MPGTYGKSGLRDKGGRVGRGRIQGLVGKCRPIFSTKESSVLPDHFLLTKKLLLSWEAPEYLYGSYLQGRYVHIPEVSNDLTFYAKHNGLVVVAAKVFHGREL